jgi:2-hydroxy-6-oxonona-2,4-dienedioate hydrolase
MRSTAKIRLLLGAVVFLSGAYVRRKMLASEREKRIGRGELRELGEIWTEVGGLRYYARVSVNQSALEYLPVVLVHGFGISSSYFVRTAERLAPFFDVYAPDLPGHGKSDTPARPLHVEGFAESLRQWMEVMHIRRASIVGNSMGCQIAVELAVRYPDVVDRLVLIGPTMDRAAKSVIPLLPRFLAGGAYERVSLNGLLVKDYLRMAGRIRHELHAMLAHRIEDKLPQVAAPVLFVRGEKDPIAPQRWVNELAHLTADSHVAVIPGWGHAVNYSAADELVALMIPFLRQNKTAGTEHSS